MLIFPSVNVKTLLIRLVSDTIFNFGPEHHLVTLHVVKHHILQLRYQSFFVDKVKVDFFISNNLYSNVTFDVIYLATAIYRIIVDPFALTSIFIFVYFEEQDFT